MRARSSQPARASHAAERASKVSTGTSAPCAPLVTFRMQLASRQERRKRGGWGAGGMGAGGRERHQTLVGVVAAARAHGHGRCQRAPAHTTRAAGAPRPLWCDEGAPCALAAAAAPRPFASSCVALREHPEAPSLRLPSLSAALHHRRRSLSAQIPAARARRVRAEAEAAPAESVAAEARDSAPPPPPPSPAPPPAAMEKPVRRRSRRRSRWHLAGGRGGSVCAAR